MSLHNLSEDISQLIINYSLIKEASNLSITNKENEKLIKKYYTCYLFHIKCSLEDYNKTFPNAKYANIRGRLNIIDFDFKYLSMVEILNMSLCEQRSITDHSFRYLSNIRDLNLQGACGHWIGGHHFTDNIFDYLINLKNIQD